MEDLTEMITECLPTTGEVTQEPLAEKAPDLEAKSIYKMPKTVTLKEYPDHIGKHMLPCRPNFTEKLVFTFDIYMELSSLPMG